MDKMKYIIIGGLSLFAALIMFWIFYETEEDRVKKQFELLSEHVEKNSKENPIISAAKANHIKDLFDEPSRFDIPLYNISKEVSLQDIGSYALAGRSRYSSLSLKFYDFIIEFPEEGKASATLTANLRGKLMTGENSDETHELNCDLVKREKIWIIKRVAAVIVLEK